MKIGSSDISAAYIGSTAINKVYIGSTEVWSAVDPDAAAFFARVTTAGGTLSATEQTAINTLVVQMKADGIWTKMKAIYPMVGASAAACAQNLKSSSFTGSFSSGWTFASTGVSGNGTSAYFETGILPSTDLSQNNISGGYYIGNDYDSESKDTLCTGGGNSFIGIYNSGGNEMAVNDSFGSKDTPTKKRGLFIFSRITSTQSKEYCNNLQIFTKNVTSNTPNSYSVKIGCLYNSGILSRYSTNSIRFAYLGDGLTDTEASDFYTAVQAFQTNLSRQV